MLIFYHDCLGHHQLETHNGIQYCARKENVIFSFGAMMAQVKSHFHDEGDSELPLLVLDQDIYYFKN